MKYYYPEDVNLTADIIWNITKYFSINPDCWFDDESSPTYTYWDSDDNDNYYDTVNVTYKLDTIMPNEHVTVNLVLHPKFNLTHPFYGIRYRHRASNHYNVTRTGLNGYINVSLPENFPYCEYVVGIYLCNSTGDATMGIFDSTVGMTGLEIVDIIYNLIRINILEREQIYDIIRDWLHLEVKDFLIRLQDHRKVRNFLIDLIGYTRLSNDSSYNISMMAPPNEPPDRPDPIDDLGLGELNYYHWYRTKTTDPEDDKIRFQWKWNEIKYPWTVRKFDSGEYCYEPHRWWSAGEKTVMVRAKNPRNPNYFSDWRETTVTVDEGCSFSVATSQTSQNNIYNPYVENSFDPSVVPVDETINFQGFSWGFSEAPDYGYDIEDSVKDHGVSKNTDDSFDETGDKYVNFTADLDGLSVYCNRTLKVVNISACYNMNKLGAKPNQNITFNDTTISKYSKNNWTWDFGDGNISYSQNVSHNYSKIGVYNVSLNVTDSNGESSEFWQIVHVETNHSNIIDATYSPIPGTLGCNVTLSAEFWDNNESGINTAYVNISYPNGTTNNFSMYLNENSSYGYEYVFNDTMQVGWYYFTIFVTDNCGNTNDFAGCGFQILPAFGNSVIGELNQNIKDNISGSNFTILVNGTAESISAYIQTNQTPSVKTKCMIYRVNDSTLIGTTEEKTINTGDEPNWVTYNFTGTKPSLTTDTQYILTCWSNDTCYLYYDNFTDSTIGRYNNTIYGSPPSPNISWDDEESRMYSIYCTYSTVPEITDVSTAPDPIGFGYNTTITAEIEHYYTLVDNITVNITYPDDTFVNNSMTKVDDDTFQYIFDYA
jgi:hypothetical protein